MASVKCEYCGSYISDSQEKCPTCGAINKDYKRVVEGTPRTIEQLKDWYKARNLPPEETTRFFIGKNITEPRAFGIYEENGKFIVYKNKSDGTRVIRYKGKDEAYAVNELYLKLKEEILNQKNINANRRKMTNSYPRTYSSTPKRKSSSFAAISVVIIVLFVTTFLSFIINISSGILSDDDLTSSYYYPTASEEIYFFAGYNDGGYEWWIYDDEITDWKVFNTYLEKNITPPGVNTQNKMFLSDLKDEFGEDVCTDIRKSKTFIDAGNKLVPKSAYYYHDNNLYYFLNDSHSDYGSTDNTGWYKYEDNEWSYYCDKDDKSALGDDLWYDDESYYISNNYGDIYDYVGDYATTWNPTNFEDTTWYESYENNEAAYDRHLEESRNNSYDSSYSNDSDWDWSSSDSWDSGSTDWDSDW
jgi:hypothetical protein